MKFTLAETTGGIAGVFNELNKLPVRGSPDTKLLMAAARNIAQSNFIANVLAEIEPVIQNTYDMYVIMNGEASTITDRHELGDWESGIDDALETTLEPYSRNFTADTFGAVVIDSALHKSETAVHDMALKLAKDAWTNITFGPSEADPKMGEPMSTAKILSAVGIVASDLANDTPSAQPEEDDMTTTEVIAARDIEDIIGEVRMTCTETDPATIKGHFINAMDEDDNIAVGGLVGLGLGFDDAPGNMDAFRMQVFAHGTPEAASDALYDIYADDPTVITEGAAEPASASAVPAPQVRTGPAPAPARPAAATPRTLPGQAVDFTGSPITVGKDTFSILRSRWKLKDEEIAGVLGISRQTFINYTTRDNVTFKVDAVVQANVMAALQEIIDDLSAARNAFEGT